jgi:hypothetical protein
MLVSAQNFNPSKEGLNLKMHQKTQRKFSKASLIKTLQKTQRFPRRIDSQLTTLRDEESNIISPSNKYSTQKCQKQPFMVVKFKNGNLTNSVE